MLISLRYSINSLEQLEDYLILVCECLKLKNDDSQADKFKDFYRFSYHFARVETRKQIDKDIAIMLWKAILTDRFPLITLWINFLEQAPQKTITLDAWSVFLDFVYLINSGGSYDPDAAWPTLIDEFVEHCHKLSGNLKDICIKKVALLVHEKRLSKSSLGRLPSEIVESIDQYMKLVGWS
eukprot:TRINITY_DN1360_c0_g2_i2.p1 TRINITY_DN1360_c0_g2~~TRINITY_DN1360_c0_g2_i2.p1  ORF type:complete len:181 (-),score=34.69 TRINITY_DN1360_c0_g2_i2:455-997(-)